MNIFLAIPQWMRVAAGAAIVAGVGLVASEQTGSNMVSRLETRAERVIAENGAGGEGGIRADFTTTNGWLTRHPTLRGGTDLPDDVRTRVARAVAAIPGVGGTHWEAGKRREPEQTEPIPEPGPFHCQRDVEQLLSVRVIRFGQGSAEIAPASGVLLDEVAAALKPCRGSIVAIIGHSDAVGDAAINLQLSRDRASAVRDALMERGIPGASMRATGVGSQQPIEGLEPEDPANRRIEFSVIEVAPLAPTPIDLPGAW
ncbi:OmpA family protein [Croceicoccus mobilis]|uniref:OmpA-like domain-containing protein n=1 Tax=Croceicoccus mobilis TaxID=1703339 RepID=A0A917DSA6_9SPHN|nr:OmpA family protein [Croceicoccus mobilis]GGD65330.1 hypothetical protein GCM10010990_13540 [Croceicoccus mobilis]